MTPSPATGAPRHEPRPPTAAAAPGLGPQGPAAHRAGPHAADRGARTVGSTLPAARLAADGAGRAATPGDTARTGAAPEVLVRYEELLAAVTGVFAARGMTHERAARAAEALCYGDLSGMASHGLANLVRLYMPLFDQGRVVPDAEPVTVADRGASVLLDARGALGLWVAGVAMELAVERAGAYGVGLVSVRGGTHLGCLGHHALRAVTHGMIGLVTSNCGRQRIARPPGGAAALLGTNPMSLAAPAGPHHPFVLDMSTTTAPTGRVRLAERAGREVPAGWLYDDAGHDVTDPGAFDRGQAHLRWLGGRPDTGAYKGYGLALFVEVLSALVSGSGFGPAPDALPGDGRPSGRDDDIGYLVAAIAPARLRDADAVTADAGSLFGSLLACPPTDPAAPVGYPGRPEGERAARYRATGVPVAAGDFAALRRLAVAHGLTPPRAIPRPGQPAGDATTTTDATTAPAATAAVTTAGPLTASAADPTAETADAAAARSARRA